MEVPYFLVHLILLFYFTIPAQSIKQQRNVKGHFGSQVLSHKNRKDKAQDAPIWPGRTVPYLIDDNFAENARRIIFGAMLQITSTTCLRFKPRWSSEMNYLNITKGQGCRTSVLKLGEQNGLTLSLENSCLTHKQIQQNLLTALGVPSAEIRHFLLERSASPPLIETNVLENSRHNSKQVDVISKICDNNATSHN